MPSPNSLPTLSITVISEDQFVKQGKTTNLERNEFVKSTRAVSTCRLPDKGVAR